MYRYAELVDAADFDGLAELFTNARLTTEGVDGAIEGGDAIKRLYQHTNRVHDDGTLRTRHLTANVQIEIEDGDNTATARSAFVVFQQTASLPLQPIVTGRYRDRFTRDETGWRFRERHIIVDHVGNVSEHLAIDLASMRRDG